MVNIVGYTDEATRKNLEVAVTEYGEDNPQVTQAPEVKLHFEDDDGEPMVVQGSFQRDALGTLVFILLKAAGDAIASAIERRGLRGKKNQRKDGRALVHAAEADPDLPADPQERYAYLEGKGLLQQLQSGYVALVGGRTFVNRAAVIAHFGELAAKTGNTEESDEPAKPEAVIADPEELAAESGDTEESDEPAKLEPKATRSADKPPAKKANKPTMSADKPPAKKAAKAASNKVAKGRKAKGQK